MVLVPPSSIYLPPGYIWPVTLPALYSTIFPTYRCLDLSPWLPPVSMSSGVMNSCLMGLPPVPYRVSTLPLQSPLLPEARTQYLLVVPGLVVALLMVGAACRGPPVELKFVTVLLWWGDLCYTCILSTISVSCSMLLASDHSPLMTLSPPLISSP